VARAFFVGKLDIENLSFTVLLLAQNQASGESVRHCLALVKRPHILTFDCVGLLCVGKVGDCVGHAWTIVDKRPARHFANEKPTLWTMWAKGFQVN
jgi:hypothetical protein